MRLPPSRTAGLRGAPAESSARPSFTRLGLLLGLVLGGATTACQDGPPDFGAIETAGEDDWDGGSDSGSCYCCSVQPAEGPAAEQQERCDSTGDEPWNTTGDGDGDFCFGDEDCEPGSTCIYGECIFGCALPSASVCGDGVLAPDEECESGDDCVACQQLSTIFAKEMTEARSWHAVTTSGSDAFRAGRVVEPGTPPRGVIAWSTASGSGEYLDTFEGAAAESTFRALVAGPEGMVYAGGTIVVDSIPHARVVAIDETGNLAWSWLGPQQSQLDSLERLDDGRFFVAGLVHDHPLVWVGDLEAGVPREHAFPGMEVRGRVLPDGTGLLALRDDDGLLSLRRFGLETGDTIWAAGPDTNWWVENVPQLEYGYELEALSLGHDAESGWALVTGSMSGLAWAYRFSVDNGGGTAMIGCNEIGLGRIRNALTDAEGRWNLLAELDAWDSSTLLRWDPVDGSIASYRDSLRPDFTPTVKLDDLALDDAGQLLLVGHTEDDASSSGTEAGLTVRATVSP